MPRAVSLTMVCAIALACADRPVDPTGPIEVPLFLHGGDGGSLADGEHFGTSMNGAAERPLPRETNARGNSIFHLSPDGATMTYRLIVANIENIVAAHIHLGPADGTGNPVVWLYPSTAVGNGSPGGGRVDGILIEGTFTAANLVNDLAGASMSDLVAAMQAGNTYVNVHTNDGVGATNTGPGDFPGGEVRGQIEHRGH